jgi:hypothetical protein
VVRGMKGGVNGRCEGEKPDNEGGAGCMWDTITAVGCWLVAVLVVRGDG